MTVSILDGCSDTCGWIAAAVAALAYGSYGVPIKACGKIDVDPLVLQSYKTIIFFLSCWLVLLLGEEVRFTRWGIVSGMLWVPGATAGIPAIKYAGMAVAVGTWASIIVMMNFIWGILIFQEGVKSFSGTLGAFILLIVGLIGMSIYSDAPSPSASDEEWGMKTIISSSSLLSKVELHKRGADIEEATSETQSISDGEDSYTAEKHPSSKAKDRIFLFAGKLSLSLRQCGVLGAVINGVVGGSCLIPMHYASLEGYSGAGFMISFAAGSLLVNAMMWLLLFLYRLQQQQGSVQRAIAALPYWHVNQLWFNGSMSGVLFSVGMFGSILAVTYLGQGVGNSFVEIQILVSGLWGIFCYKEIAGSDIITKWFVSATVTVLGILWLSYEHESDRVHRHH